MVVALEITAIGMSLVFAAILLFWLLMALLVRLTAGRRLPAAEPAAAAEGAAASAVSVDVQHELRRRAAAAAVVAALSLEPSAPHGLFPLPPTALVSAWQAVMRANALRQRGPVRQG